MSEASLSVTALPAFADNYIWLVDNRTCAIVVDPGDFATVDTALRQRALTLSAIVLTHRHEDHIGGVKKLVSQFSVPVYGPQSDEMPFVSHPVSEKAPLVIASLPVSFTVLSVPGHTREHLAYYAPDQQWLFCGDMLFGAGCGRMFEGTAGMMIASLAQFSALPDETRVFSAHEYTLSNLKFAQEIEPNNQDIRQRIEVETAKREKKQPTLPSTIGLEKKTNPFLRHAEETVINRLLALNKIDSKDNVSAFAAMREWKNVYR
ncbi:MAG: hydroxyacylglutathione hydrolase [Burkholderiaceae bacterium]|nr:hydroxyacylglutathione hydrolase [Burkholderiaceae bacterium]